MSGRTKSAGVSYDSAATAALELPCKRSIGGGIKASKLASVQRHFHVLSRCQHQPLQTEFESHPLS